MRAFFTALLMTLLFSFLLSQFIAWQALLPEQSAPPSPLLAQLSQEAAKFYPPVFHQGNATIIRDSFPSPELALRYAEQKEFLQVYADKTGEEIEFTLYPEMSLASYNYSYSSFAKEEIMLRTGGQPVAIALKLDARVDRVESNWHWTAQGQGDKIAVLLEDAEASQFSIANQTAGFISPSERNQLVLYSGNQTLILTAENGEIKIRPAIPCSAEFTLEGRLYPLVRAALGFAQNKETWLFPPVS